MSDAAATDPSTYVLVVEDDTETSKLLVTLFRKAGYEARGVDDGTTAMTALDERRPDLLCVDLGLPLVSGFELVNYVRSNPKLKGLPVLVVTARTTLEDATHAQEAGADVIVYKPFKRRHLLDTAGELLARPRKTGSR